MAAAPHDRPDASGDLPFHPSPPDRRHGDSQRADPKRVLETVFGHRSFRGPQRDIVEHVVSGGDALVVMPTGSGKSLCYQIPALVRPGVGVVVSPLIALMHDQVTAMRHLGVRVAALNSSLAYDEARQVERDAVAGDLDLLYVAPERVNTEGFLALLRRMKVALFAIDEAHCVSQWGHDFRPDYMALAVLGERFPGVPRMALTATADAPTRKDIVERLGLADARAFVTGFDRPNIRYRVTPKHNGSRQILDFLEPRRGQAGIVYCFTRKDVEATATMLAGHGYPAIPYHAGLDKAVRAGNQRRFQVEDGVIVVATIAFGMGIDKPDVRFVVHADPPKSVEAYYQETGRAGRDGLPAETLMLHGLGDMMQLRQLIEAGEAPEKQKHIERQKLDALLGFCETVRCRRQVLLEYFGDANAPGVPCGNCDTCLDPPETFDGSVAAQKALSAVYRTGERFGAGHIVDVLVGNVTERVTRFGHESIKTFGAGKEFAAPDWRGILRQLVALGLLRVDLAGYGGLALGEDCGPVLRGERPVLLRRDAATRKAERSRRGTARRTEGAGAPLGVDPAAAGLFEALRQRRAELARREGVPAYVIFHDSTLAAMAAARPADLAALRALPGIGDAKLQRYGDTFLDAIRAFADAR